jgi:hypothetical protein
MNDLMPQRHSFLIGPAQSSFFDCFARTRFPGCRNLISGSIQTVIFLSRMTTIKKEKSGKTRQSVPKCAEKRKTRQIPCGRFPRFIFCVLCALSRPALPTSWSPIFLPISFCLYHFAIQSFCFSSFLRALSISVVKSSFLNTCFTLHKSKQPNQLCINPMIQ